MRLATIAILVLLSTGCEGLVKEEPEMAPPPTTLIGDANAAVQIYEGEIKMGGAIDAVQSVQAAAWIFWEAEGVCNVQIQVRPNLRLVLNKVDPKVCGK